MSTTPNYGLGVPAEINTVAEEFYRLQATIGALDTLIKALNTAVSGKAATTHAHTMAQITGLVAALAAKQDAGQTFKLDDLTDVTGATAAANGYILVKTSGGFIAQSALSALGGHGHTIAEIAGLAAALADGSTTTAKLADKSVTPQKMADVLFQKATARPVSGNNRISNGILFLDPQFSLFRIDPEALAATDDLTNIVQTDGSEWPIGSDILLATSSSARDVTVKHNANANAGLIHCRAGQDISMVSANIFVRLVKWSATTWILTDRSIPIGGSAELPLVQEEERAALGLPALFDAKADLAAMNAALGVKADTSTVNTALGLKANLASPALTGSPTAPTQAAGNNSTRLSTTAFVVTAIANALSGLESGIGYGQSWQNVTRANGTSYQNTTGKPIMVSVSSPEYYESGGAYFPLSATINVGTATAPTQIAAQMSGSTGGAGGSSGISTQSIAAIVPPNHFYRIVGTSITVRELR